MANPLVSIIIPTYNRAHLIGETLDSILAQTYTNWECIVIDDGSGDDTDKIMQEYCNKDFRFHYYHRPKERQPGGNGARNYGLKISSGEYIIFFDSDDLMTEDHVQVKVEAIIKHQVDYVITKTKFFNSSDNYIEKYYKFNQYKITAHNYIIQNINWLTCDTLIKAPLAKHIEYDERLKTGQEYNYYAKLVMKSQNAGFIPKYISLRRKHDNSKQGILKGDEETRIKNIVLTTWYTYLAVEEEVNSDTSRILLFKIIKYCFLKKKILIKEREMFFKHLTKHFQNGAILFRLMLFFEKYFKRGYYFRKRLKLQL